MRRWYQTEPRHWIFIEDPKKCWFIINNNPKRRRSINWVALI